MKNIGKRIRDAKVLSSRSWLPMSGAALLFGCSGTDREPDSLNASSSVQPVVYQNQSQVEFDNGTNFQKEFATAIGVLMPSASIAHRDCPDPNEVSFGCTAVLSVIDKVLCDDEQWASQHSINDSCTAFMIRNEPNESAVFATNRHCLNSVTDCSDRSVVLRWRATSQIPNGNPETLEQHIYRCTTVLAEGGQTSILSGPGDWAIFEVDRHVTGGAPTGGPLTPDVREALTIAAGGPVEGATGLTIGHPIGMPTKIDPEVKIGPLRTNRGAGTFYAFLDAMDGQSGSPIFNDNGEVVGILGAAKGPVLDTSGTRSCMRQCFDKGGNPICPPLTGLLDTDPNAFATIAVNITQLPTTFRTGAEHVMIILDETGSMTIPGMSDGVMRWDDAVSAAVQWIEFDKLTSVFIDRAYAISTFKDDRNVGGTQHGAVQIWPVAGSTDCGQIDADGYCLLARGADTTEYDALQQRLETIREEHRPATAPTTPLAQALCETMETLRAIPGIKRVIFESDGGENATDAAHACFGIGSEAFGDWSTDLTLREIVDWGMTLDSWEAKVVRRATRLSSLLDDAVASPLTVDDSFPFDFIWHVDVHFGTAVPTMALAKGSAAGPNPEMVGAARSLLAASSSDGELPFFISLGNVNPKSTFTQYIRTGEVFGIDHPVAGDVNNDGCVDQADICELTIPGTWMTRAILPNTNAVNADVTRDGWVNGLDVDLTLDSWGNGCKKKPGPAPVPRHDNGSAHGKAFRQGFHCSPGHDEAK